jgi:D-sedoheptulose 7-phosphate isomerase
MSRHLLDPHVRDLVTALQNAPELVGVATRWGEQLAELLGSGARLLVAGNGGSAAQAQHLTAELVGRYDGDRRAFSAIALHAETSSMTAILNDYGGNEVFARQIEAHGRPGDVCLLMSTSGKSPNLVTAACRAKAAGLLVWAMTGARPNPLAQLSDDQLCVDAERTCTVQEVHLVAVHLICEAMDAALTRPDVRPAPLKVAAR